MLITGGSGFLGSHLCDRLVAEGHRVICVDSFLTGSRDKVSHLLEHPSFSLVTHDVTEPLSLSAGTQVDCVLNLASPASPKDYARYPIETLMAGALGTYNTLDLAREHGATYLLASSSEVYGDPEVNPQTEDYHGHVNPVGPRSVYDEAKRFAEALATAYYHSHGLDVRIARIFNTYGPRMSLDDGRAVPTFIAQALRGEPLTVYGSGAQTRSFCHVDDTVEALYRLLVHERSPSRPGGAGARAPQLGDASGPLIVNIGNPEEVTVLELAKEIVEISGSLAGLAFEPLPTDDPKVRRPDITRARLLLDWDPKVRRSEGLKRLLPYFKSALGATTYREHVASGG